MVKLWIGKCIMSMMSLSKTEIKGCVCVYACVCVPVIKVVETTALVSRPLAA